MQKVIIQWHHLDVQGKTCDRCADTGSAILTAIALLKKSLRPLVTVEFEEKLLAPSGIEDSNAVLINGVPLEQVLRAEVGSNCCDSCSCLVGEKTDCRTILLDGQEYEDIPPELIIKAVRITLGLPV